MKTILFCGWVLIAALVHSMGISQTTAPTISDLQISGCEGVKPGESCNVTYSFKSNQRPDEVIVDRFWSGGQARGSRAIYSSKKGELQVAVTQKEGVYEVAASRNASGPPAIARGTNFEVEVWTISGGNKSNKLKTIIPIE
jgi:hypothetical protein